MCMYTHAHVNAFLTERYIDQLNVYSPFTAQNICPYAYSHGNKNGHSTRACFLIDVGTKGIKVPRDMSQQDHHGKF